MSCALLFKIKLYIIILDYLSSGSYVVEWTFIQVWFHVKIIHRQGGNEGENENGIL